MPLPKPSPAVIEARFWRKVNKSGECWLWTGTKNRKGYGMFNIGRKRLGTHRFAYELTQGAIPAGRVVCHTCDNPSCVRPDHLWLGTNSDNIRDAVSKGRHKPYRKLAQTQVDEIRQRYVRGVYGYKRLADDYGVGYSTIVHLIKGESWRA